MKKAHGMVKILSQKSGVENGGTLNTAREPCAQVNCLLKDGLRAVTGLLSKRGREAYPLESETSTNGIRGTTFAAGDCVNHREDDCKRLEPAVYVGVADGEIVVRHS